MNLGQETDHLRGRSGDVRSKVMATCDAPAGGVCGPTSRTMGHIWVGDHVGQLGADTSQGENLSGLSGYTLGMLRIIVHD